MLSIVFHFRPSSCPSKDEGSIFVRLIYNRQSINMTLQHKIRRTEWNPVLQEPVSLTTDSFRCSYLEQIRKEMRRMKKELLQQFENKEENKDKTLREIVAAYRFQKKEKGITAWVNQLSADLKEAGRERTARAYRSSLNSFLHFLDKKDISFDRINRTMVVSYEQSLKQRKRSLNTISFYMRNLRAICNKAVRRGITDISTTDLFSGVYTRIATTRKRALTKKEMKSLENLLGENTLPVTWKESIQLFLFAFHARGMSYVDLAHLRKEDLDPISNKLTYFRRKTGQYIEMQMNPPMQKIIRYFRESTQGSPYLFPVIRNDRTSSYLQYSSGLRIQNERLKKIAEYAGIRQALTTHQARHAWATIAKQENIPVWVISEGLGHTSVSTTYIYLDSFNTSVLDKAHRKISKAVSTAGQ